MYIVNSQNRHIRINHGATVIEVPPFKCEPIPTASIEFIKQLKNDLKLTLSETEVSVQAPQSQEPEKVMPPAKPEVSSSEPASSLDVVGDSKSAEADNTQKADDHDDDSSDDAKPTTRRRRRE